MPTSSPAPSQQRRRRWIGRLAWALLAAAVLSSAYALWSGLVSIPERWNPWAPLDAAAPPNLLTGFKLRRARTDPVRCMAALARAGLPHEAVPDRVTGAGCGFENAVRVRRGHSLALGSPLVLSCGAALSFAMWERHALQPAAERHLGAPLVSLDHLGSYACRNVNTGEGTPPGSRRSRHATADAFDISGFTPSGGLRITVRRRWGGDDAEALFLRDAHTGACRFFDGVLGPDYNAVHADHFHLEVGGWGICR
ncbi:extensin family protein [Variovorax paradoxus]|nr:extensin family protein [Variovorax paradoxus]